MNTTSTIEANMKFSDLPIGAVFEFDHTGIPFASTSLAHGPWTKTGPRTYEGAGDRERHADICRTYSLGKAKFQPHRVGTINVKVIVVA